MQHGLLMKENQLVAPFTMRIDVIERLHDAHQGITKCHERAKASVWWPDLSNQLEEVVKQCPTCIKERVNPAEPVILSELPNRPWQKVAADLFELKGHPYLLVIDYFSHYKEVAKLSSTTSPDVTAQLSLCLQDMASLSNSSRTMDRNFHQPHLPNLLRTMDLLIS